MYFVKCQLCIICTLKPATGIQRHCGVLTCIWRDPRASGCQDALSNRKPKVLAFKSLTMVLPDILTCIMVFIFNGQLGTLYCFHSRYIILKFKFNQSKTKTFQNFTKKIKSRINSYQPSYTYSIIYALWDIFLIFTVYILK